MKKLVKVLAVVLAIATLTACLCFTLTACNTDKGITDSSPEGIKEYGKLVVATNAYFPPFEFVDKSGKITGWDMELAKALADKLGVELEILNVEFDSVLVAPGTNKAHIAMAGISKTEERDKTMDFTDGVFNSSQVIIVKNGSTISGPMDLAGKVVGCQLGTIGQYLGNMDPDYAFYEDEFGQTVASLGAPKQCVAYTTGAEAVMALKNGSIDAVIIDKYPAESFVKAYEGIKILSEAVYEDEYAFAVAEGNKALVDWLNQAIAELKADGTMEALNQKYFA
ncbi:MAG: transporter substrate-binding domain-containing protein [Clostridia bacterium]|nr:transporter substrate-binding domain-containing protein [Clostridia bacterium]